MKKEHQGLQIYLDVCCLNRPFDDQSQDRIYLETTAILTVFKHIETGKWTLVNSDAIKYETFNNPDNEKKNKVLLLSSKATIYSRLDQKILLRAREINKLGIGVYDALHVASAEKVKSDIFLTTDDNLLMSLRKHRDKIYIEVNNPLDWIKEVI